MLREIERFTKQRLTPVKMPTRADVAARRQVLFKERLLKTLQEVNLELHLSLVEELAEESGRDLAEIAAAAAHLAQGDRPLVVPLEPEPDQVPHVEDGMVRLFLNAGRSAGVRPADIVGAIANEAGVPGKQIGPIDIYDDFTLVDVPAAFHAAVLKGLAGATLRRQPIRVRLATTQDIPARRPPRRPGPKPGYKPGPKSRPSQPERPGGARPPKKRATFRPKRPK